MNVSSSDFEERKIVSRTLFRAKIYIKVLNYFSIQFFYQKITRSDILETNLYQNA